MHIYAYLFIFSFIYLIFFYGILGRFRNTFFDQSPGKFPPLRNLFLKATEPSMKRMYHRINKEPHGSRIPWGPVDLAVKPERPFFRKENIFVFTYIIPLYLLPCQVALHNRRDKECLGNIHTLHHL